MENKILYSITLVLLCVNLVSGQDSLDLQMDPFPKIIFTFSPLNMINPRVPAAQIGMEYRVAKKLALQHEAGYVYWKASKDSSFRFREKKGYRLRTELRYYFAGMDKEPQRDYFGFQVRYWQFKAPTESEFFRAGGQFQQRLTYNVKQSGIGVGMSYGFNIITKRNFVFDFGMSGGLIRVKNRPEGIPDDAESFDEEAFLFSRNHSVAYNSTQPYILVTLKFGFALD